jgi:ubiquinone/menaquinone biosynthesis C-methylase UbiE
MAEVFDKKRIRKVFRNVQKHRLIEQLIRQFSTNKEDIRKNALLPADISSCQNILELGCAFGSFTESLKGRLHPEARINGWDIVPEYKPFFLEACKRAGYEGTFSSSGVNKIKKYPAHSFDLVICSFALYFFADMIPEIARVLKKDGKFITITHCQSNMRELIAITRSILEQNHGYEPQSKLRGIIPSATRDCSPYQSRRAAHTVLEFHNKLLAENEPLPIEVIIRQFSAENGRELLNKNFGQIISIDFKNTLIFQPHEINFFIEYFHFKSPFFLIGTKTDSNIITTQLVHKLQGIAAKEKVINMCKDDRIFICSDPFPTKEQT